MLTIYAIDDYLTQFRSGRSKRALPNASRVGVKNVEYFC
jgi:hypothetical protein